HAACRALRVNSRSQEKHQRDYAGGETRHPTSYPSDHNAFPHAVIVEREWGPVGRYGNTAIATLDHRDSRRYGSIAITPLWTPLLLSTSGLRSTRWASRAFRQNPAEPDDSHRALPSRRGHTLSTRRVLPGRAEWKRVGQAHCRA